MSSYGGEQNASTAQLLDSDAIKSCLILTIKIKWNWLTVIKKYFERYVPFIKSC
jgi:hypothetical protein